MKRTDKYLYIMAALAACGLAMWAIESGAEQAGLELRTFAQEIKGIYLWLIMPLGILCAANASVKKKAQERENPKVLHRVRKVLVTLLTLAILGTAFLRGAYYMFADEMVEEERMSDGYLKGTRSGFPLKSSVSYYETEAGLFRRLFPGWDRQQLTRRIQEEFGAEAEYAGGQPGGWHVFRLPDPVAEGEFIFFHVSEGYEMENNACGQILLSQAAHFWENRGRGVMLGEGGGIALEEARDTGEELESLPQQQNLCITCYDTEEEITFCAGNLTDWLQFVRNTGQYPWGKDAGADGLLSRVWVGSGEDYFLFNMEPEKVFTRELSWDECYHQMKEKLTEAFRERREEKEAYGELIKEQESGAEKQERETWDFMDTYDGSFEKECQVEDGRIRYRMVVEDAALGSRFYGLLKSTDAGESWEMSNPDPFDQQMGQGIDFTFLDENLGFAALMHNGGDEAQLYVTEDGGQSYELVAMEGYTVSLEDGFTYNPYDYPQMPYAQGNRIFVLCGQGADGDYNGGDQAGLALYQSDDGGHTFSFVRIQSPR